MTAKVIRRTLEEATNVGKNHLLFNTIINLHQLKILLAPHFFPSGKLTNRFSKENVCLKPVEIIIYYKLELVSYYRPGRI